MSNDLVKTTNISFIPGKPGIPADPGQPYSPPYWIYNRYLVYRYVPLDAYAKQLGYFNGSMALNPGEELVFVPSGYDASGMLTYTPYVRVKALAIDPVLVPAKPYIAPTPAVDPVPAQTLYDFNIGWNSGARSIVSDYGSGEFTFSTPAAAAGVVLGLSVVDTDGGIAGMPYAVYFGNGAAYAMEYGRIKATIGANTGQTWGIKRVHGSVSITEDGATVHEFPTESTYPMFLDSSLYVGGDAVNTPAYTPGGDGEALLRPIEGLGGDYTEYAMAGGTLPALSGWGFGEEMVYMSGLQALGGDTQYAGGTSLLQALTGAAEDGGTPAPAVGVGGGFLNFMTATSAGVVGEVGDGDGELAPLQGIGADADYSGGTASLGYLFGVAGGETNGLLNLRFAGVARASMEGVSAAILSLIFQAQVATSLSSAKLHVAEVNADGQVSTPITATAEYLLDLLFQVMGMAMVEDPNAAAFAWACAQEGGRVSRYDGYGFQSFAKIGGRHYGVRTDGVYLLEGDTDDGEAIPATAHFGKMNFNSPSIKTVPNVYVGVGAQETLFLRVETRQGTFLYRARRASANMQTQRFDLGRGLRDNWFDFVLVSPDCSGFDLDNIEFTPVMSKRRI